MPAADTEDTPGAASSPTAPAAPSSPLPPDTPLVPTASLRRLSRWLLLGEWRAHPLRALVAVAAIAVGIALGFAIHLINAAAFNEFSAAVKSLSGVADVQVRGTEPFFDEAIYPLLAQRDGVALASPVLELDAAVPGQRSALKVIGLDALRAGVIAPDLIGVPADGNRDDLLADDAIFLSPAAQQWLQPDGRLALQVGARRLILRVAGSLQRARAGQRLGVMDIGAAQWRFDRLGQLSRIDLKLRDGVDRAAFQAALAQQLQHDYPGRFRVNQPNDEDQADSNAGMSRAYRVNLTVLAMVALFTGAFLVFSTQALSVIRRRSQFALLRVLGLERGRLLRQILFEGLWLGVAGAALGIAAGYGLAAAALHFMGADLGAGFFAGVRPQVQFTPLAALVYFVLGVAVALLGCAAPALDAARARPAVALKSGTEEAAIARLARGWPGLACMALAAVLTQLPPVWELPLFGYLAIALLLIGAISLMPRLAATVFRRAHHYWSAATAGRLEAPVMPATPVTPATPATPVTPAAPVTPAIPATPVTPAAPAATPSLLASLPLPAAAAPPDATRVATPPLAHPAFADRPRARAAATPRLVRLLTAGRPGAAAVLTLTLARLANASSQAGIALGGVLSSFSLMVAMAIMVASFRVSLDDWLLHILPADLYVSTAAGATAGLGPAEQSAIAALPGVARVDFLRQHQLALAPGRPPVTLMARNIDVAAPARLLAIVGAPYTPAAGEPPPVWVSEAMVDLYGMRPGQHVRLPLAGQPRAFTVAGVWRDYARPTGTVQIRLRDYRALTGDRDVNGAALTLRAGTPAAAVQQALQRLPFGALLDVSAPSAIRAMSMRIFDRSFAITYLLEAIAIVIGLFGVAVTFSAQTLARAKEFGMLRHVGVTRGQVLAILAIEGGALTALGIVTGFVLGWVISLVLVFVVNPQSFHWSMQLHLPWPLLGAVAGLLLAAAALTALLAGRQALSGGPIRAVREDW